MTNAIQPQNAHQTLSQLSSHKEKPLYNLPATPLKGVGKALRAAFLNKVNFCNMVTAYSAVNFLTS